MRTIVVSAVNLNVGGTLAILKACLGYLSSLAAREELRVVAIVYDRSLIGIAGIEYIETRWPKKRWVNRLWFEYVSLKKISRDLGAVDLWLSLHDTTPSVVAKRRAVYCHNAFSFFKWKWPDLWFAPKMVLFALFTRYIYRINLHKNDYLITQQQWMRRAMHEKFGVNMENIIVAPPKQPSMQETPISKHEEDSWDYTFMFPAAADSHKNFQVICRACQILESQYKRKDFKVRLTVSGKENRYTRWLHRNWGHLETLEFTGYLDRGTLHAYYQDTDCLIFPSKVETWGLPISEFGVYDKPMLLAEAPYARETAAGHDMLAFFDPDDPEMLAGQMRQLIDHKSSFLRALAKVSPEPPVAASWEHLFAMLLKDPKTNTL